MYYIKAAAYGNFKGALGTKSWEFRSPTHEVKGVAVNNSGAQSYSLDAPGYWAPVRQQPWIVLDLVPL